MYGELVHAPRLATPQKPAGAKGARAEPWQGPARQVPAAVITAGGKRPLEQTRAAPSRADAEASHMGQVPSRADAEAATHTGQVPSRVEAEARDRNDSVCGVC